MLLTEPADQKGLEWAKGSRHFDAVRLLGGSGRAEHSVRLPKQTRAEKISGVYEHNILHPHALLTRVSTIFLAPHSRYVIFRRTYPR